MLGFKIVVIDDREEFANAERFPEAEMVLAEDFANSFAKLKIDKSSYIAIVTRGHQFDDVVHVVGNRFEGGAGDLLGAGDLALPVGVEHPGVAGGPDHAVPLGDGLDHVVGELALPRCEGPAVVVRRTDRAVVEVQDLPEGDVGRVGEVYDDAGLAQRVEQRLRGAEKASLCAGPV